MSRLATFIVVLAYLYAQKVFGKVAGISNEYRVDGQPVTLWDLANLTAKARHP